MPPSNRAVLTPLANQEFRRLGEVAEPQSTHATPNRRVPLDVVDTAGEAICMTQEARGVVQLAAEALMARQGEHRGGFNDAFLENALRCAARVLRQANDKLTEIEDSPIRTD